MDKIKSRSPNWTSEEIKVLVDEVCQRYGTLFHNFSGPSAADQRRMAWKEISTAVDGCRTDVFRTVDDCQAKWKHTKSAAKKAYNIRSRALAKTGGGPPPADLDPLFAVICAAVPEEGLIGLVGVDTA